MSPGFEQVSGNMDSPKKSSSNSFLDGKERVTDFVTPTNNDAHISFKKKFLDERKKAKKSMDYENKKQ